MTEVALIVGGGPGVSASCARLFSQQGMRVAVAARNPTKPALTKLARLQLPRTVNQDWLRAWQEN